MKEHIKTLIIDNYDSYTFNLLQLFDNDSNIVVVRNDQFTWEEFTTDILPHFDNVIISPGPGKPDRPSDFGLCTQLLQAQLDPLQAKNHRPVFGVCLGHQGIAHFMGGKVIHTPRIMHGRMSQVHYYDHQQNTTYKDLLHGCPTSFWAVRYHSLVVDKDSLPKDLLLTSYCYENDADMDALKNATFLSDTNDETSAEKHHFLNHIDYQNTTETPITVMGFQHRYLPLWGVQYHPESVSTEHGAKLISNFQAATYQWMLEKRRPLSTTPLSSHLLAYSAAVPKIAEKQTNPQKYQLYIKTSSHSWVDPDLLVEQLLTNDNVENMSWLDSSRSNSPYSRMSVLSTHPAMTMTYSTLHKQVRTTHRQNQATQISQLDPDTTFFDHVSDFLRQCGQVTPVALDKHARGVTDMEFQGGLVGYFGYEMKRESLPGYATPAAQACHCPSHDGDHCCVCVEEPDAAFQFVDRFFVFDLLKKQVYICCLVAQEPINQILSWIDAQEQTFIDTAKRIHKRQLANELINFTPASSARTSPTPFAANDGLFTPDVEHQHYLKTIEQCVDYIREGESYELCLTTRFRLQLPKQTMDLWRLYTHYLRRNNPAPFSALLMFPNLSLLSSSPERFLKVSADHVAEMKPIKGTIARALKCVCEENCCDFGAACEAKRLQEDEMRKQQLWQDVKERAENLMIVDLIRNDLAQVCTPSSVRVPKLMHVETYEKVHHLVSTVRGQLHPHVNSVEAVQKCFPPGSMTGAPKLRSVQLLDELEQQHPRGVYSGCLGYFSLSGSADFNVVIRTAVASTKADGMIHVSVGGGGAITFLSNPEQEWKETLLKTKSVAPSVKEFLDNQ